MICDDRHNWWYAMIGTTDDTPVFPTLPSLPPRPQALCSEPLRWWQIPQLSQQGTVILSSLICKEMCYHFTCLCIYLSCSFIHLVVCLTTCPKPLPKRALHIVQSRASSFKWEYPLLSLRSSSSFLRLLPRLLGASIPPFIFPSITRSRRQFLRKMWPIQFAFAFRGSNSSCVQAVLTFRNALKLSSLHWGWLYGNCTSACSSSLIHGCD
jgi:hypothetical protein